MVEISRRGRFGAITAVMAIAAIGVIGLSLAGYAGEVHFLLDLTSHFKLQYWLMSLVCSIFFALSRRWRWLAIALVGVVLNGVLIAPWYLPVAQAAAPTLEAPLRVMVANVLAKNQQPDRLLDLVRSQQPDLLITVEMNARWIQDLQPLAADYPYSIQSPHAARFGIVVYSKTPLQVLPMEPIVPRRDYYLAARWQVKNRNLVAIAMHPPPPLYARYAARRNQTLATVANHVQALHAQGETVIVGGDLNITPWSSYYRQFELTAKLVNSRWGFGILPTWPFGRSLFSIPIDHVLASPTLRATQTVIGPNIGSDHRPVIVEYR
ncbi:endonuclease/exonuclease/phosphatase family protein [Leptolyngbya sp. AN02str]|uniref:endonuclease/exonuclease/phosphatase family protein n=1 Tax=Leptolyngbya sp. AN02str TaxID=3423363 RepID=UPI003D30F2C4